MALACVSASVEPNSGCMLLPFTIVVQSYLSHDKGGKKGERDMERERERQTERETDREREREREFVCVC